MSQLQNDDQKQRNKTQQITILTYQICKQDYNKKATPWDIVKLAENKTLRHFTALELNTSPHHHT